MNSSRLFTASCVALIVTAMSFAMRGAATGDWVTQYHLTHEQVGWVNGSAFWGFTLAMIFGAVAKAHVASEECYSEYKASSRILAEQTRLGKTRRHRRGDGRRRGGDRRTRRSSGSRHKPHSESTL